MKGLAVVLAFLGVTAAPPAYKEAVDVRVVLVDVSVTDKAGNFIEGLSAEDFEVLDDGTPCSVQSVRAVRHSVPSQAARAVATPAERAKAEPTPPTRIVPPRHFVFLYDFSALPLRPFGLWRAGEAAAKWSRANLRPEDRVSIATFESTLRFLAEDQPPSEQLHRMLAETARQVVDSPFDAELLADPFFQLEPQVVQALQDIEIGRQTFNADRMVRALEALALRLESRPGRKAVFLVSAGHSMSALLPRPGSMAARSAALRIFHEQLSQRFQAADAAIYSLHTAGLSPTGDLAERRRLGFSGSDAFARGRNQEDIWSEQDFLTFLSEETGGQMVRNSNDYLKGFERLGRGLTAYYQVSYAAPAGKPGDFRDVDVRVRRPRVKVRHKAGYFVRKPFGAMDEIERDRDLVSQLGGSGTSAEFPAGVVLVPTPLAADRVWLGVVVRVPGPTLVPPGSSGSTLQILAEARLPLGGPTARLHEILHLEDVADLERLRVGGLEYVGGFELPRMAGSVRVVLRNDRDGRMARVSLPFDLRATVQAPLLVESATRPVRTRRPESTVAASLLALGDRQLHPVWSRQVQSGDALSLLVQLPGTEPEGLGQLSFVLRDAGGRTHPLEPARLDHESRPGRLAVLAEIVLPAIEAGRCALELRGEAGGEAFEARLPLECL